MILLAMDDNTNQVWNGMIFLGILLIVGTLIVVARVYRIREQERTKRYYHTPADQEAPQEYDPNGTAQYR